MSAGAGAIAVSDPLTTLRGYAALAPWSLRDLSALAGAILDSSGVFPINAAARAHPSERTIRFYVSRKLVTPPEGRGTAAIYGYRHLLQILGIKLQQMEGATLESLEREFVGLPGDVVERRVAAALGSRLPPPDQLPLTVPAGEPRGKVGRALRAWGLVPGPVRATPAEGPERTVRAPAGRVCRRLKLEGGAELLLDEQHPLFSRAIDDAAVAAAVERALAELQ